MKKLVIFDFDGTIVDSMPYWDSLTKQVFDKFNLDFPEEYNDIFRRITIWELSHELEEKYPVLGNYDTIVERFMDMMEVNYLNYVPFKKGAIELLDYLKANDYEIYLASATRYKLLMKALNKMDLTKYFGWIITEDLVGLSKRNPKIYDECVKKSGISLENVYLFEDADHALKTAHDYGIKTCAINDLSMSESKDFIHSFVDCDIDDFTNIEKIKEFLSL